MYLLLVITLLVGLVDRGIDVIEPLNVVTLALICEVLTVVVE